MPGRTRYIAALMLALLILPVDCFALQKGDPFPLLSGRTLDSEAFDFAQLKGSPFLLKIGTTWCPACKEQNTEITKISDILNKHKIQFVEVYVQEPEPTVRSFLIHSKEKRADIILLDAGDIARKLNVFAIPRILLIDGSFKVFSDTNPVDATFLKTSIMEMLTNN